MAVKQKTSKKKTIVKKSGIGLFDHINHIYEKQSDSYFASLSDADKKTWSTYMINRFLSMNYNQVDIINELQKYSKIPSAIYYRLLIDIIPKGRQYNSYIKGKSEDKYESWLVDLISKHFECKKMIAIEYIDILCLTEKGKLSIYQLCEQYAIDEKLTKKLKL